MRILLTGGGTGGHIMPIVAVTEELQKSDKKIELLWIGEKNSQEEAVAKKHNINFKAIACGKFRRYFSFKNFIDFFRIPVGFFQARRVLKKWKPDAIFSKGGYVSAPILFAAKKFKIPYFIHESDSVPGVANLFFAKDAAKIFITFQESKKYFKDYLQKIVEVGMPLRFDVLFGNRRYGHKNFALEDGGGPVILFLGGSQGAKKINDLVLEMLPRLVKKYQIIHLFGEKNLKEIKNKLNLLKKSCNLKHYHPFTFLDGENLAHAILVSDLIISRAGANALFELACAGKPLILIPYPYAARNHQFENAKIFEKAGAAIILEESNIGVDGFLKEIEKIIENQNLKNNLSANILKIYNKLSKDAGKKIVNEILK